jgi:CheY-like chemotaxis protein
MDTRVGGKDRRADRGSRILVVEDIAVTRELLRALLLDAGYQVALAPTAAEAMAHLERELPDLLMLDLLLPDRNGLEVCRALRGLPGGDDVPCSSSPWTTGRRPMGRPSGPEPTTSCASPS